MKIETRKISELANDPNNARTHDRKNIEAIKGSLAKFKQQKPIVIDKNNVVIAGNGTLEAAKELGWQTIDVVVTSLDKFDKTAFALADNQTATLAEWDDQILDEQLKALTELDFDISDIGFDTVDIDKELAEPSEKDDEVPELEDDNPYGVELGDIWQLGDHRLMCGDSTVKENVDKLMNGQKADLLYFDPPFQDENSKQTTIFKNASEHVEEGNLIFASASRVLREMFNTISENNWKYRYDVIWNRQIPLLGANLEKPIVFHTTFDVYRRGKSFFNRKNDSVKNYLDDIDRLPSLIKGMKEKEVGRGGKPQLLMCPLVETFSNKLVLDPCSGNGSTLIACQKTNRLFRGIEIEPSFCSIIIKRYVDFVGSEENVRRLV